MKYWNPVPTTCQNISDMLSNSTGNGSCIAWSQLFHEVLRALGVSGSQIYEIQADSSVNPGADGFLVKNWLFGKHVRAGLNTKCDTTATGDDYQATAVGVGTSINTICITPGHNGVLDTSTVADDIQLEGISGISDYPYVMNQFNWGTSGGSQGVTWGDAIPVAGIAGQSNSSPPEFFFNHFVVKYGGSVYDPSYGAGPYPSEINHENAAISGIKATSSGGVQVVKKNNVTLQELKYIAR
jgi:hypothetical protein